MYIICGQKYLCLLLIGIKLHIRTTLNATKSVCNEEEYACLQIVSPKQESTSQGTPNESVSFNDSKLRSKCISLDKFCDSFPDCENQLDEPHGCSQCTKSEKRCRYQIVFLLERCILY